MCALLVLKYKWYQWIPYPGCLLNYAWRRDAVWSVPELHAFFFFFFNRCPSPCAGTTGYKACYQEVLKVVKGIVHQPLGLKGDGVFYAFSYYYDRAVDAGLIGE